MFLFRMDLGKIVKKKYKITYIADKADMSIGYISQVLTGNKTCPLGTAEKIVQAITGKEEIEYKDLDEFFTRVK